MERLVILAIIGFIAQLVDGSLGMAYGLTSTSLLLLYGIAPSIASASVHLSEVVTTAAAGIAHWKFGNIDRGMLRRLILPGSIGAFVGACFLSYLPGEVIKPFIAGFLFLLGIYIMFRFTRQQSNDVNTVSPSKKWLDVPLGLVAGFFDAIGGGGWGPLATPALLARRELEPRIVIGTVTTSEFAVALAASVGFLLSLGWGNIEWRWVLILMAGGILAAPLAAWIVKKVHPEFLGVTVGGMILFTNAQILLTALKAPQSVVYWIYGIILFYWLLAFHRAWRNFQQKK